MSAPKSVANCYVVSSRRGGRNSVAARASTSRSAYVRVGVVRCCSSSHTSLRIDKAQFQRSFRELEAEVQSLRLHPRDAPLIVDGAFGLPMVIDAPREIERLNTVIAQLRSALERLSSRDALDEVRCAIREYRDAEKRRMLGGQRRH
jgi:hypothetical protein